MEGDLDLLLLALPWEMRGVSVQPVRDPFRLAYREGTERVEPENYRFSRLDADSILLLEDGHRLRDHALAACKIRGLQKVRRFAADSLLTLIEMVDGRCRSRYLLWRRAATARSALRGRKVGRHPLIGGELQHPRLKSYTEQ